jgi:outer membrane protein/protease secretion system outer membrane protein
VLQHPLHQQPIGLQLNIPLFLGGYVNATVRQVALRPGTRQTLIGLALRPSAGAQEFRSVTEGCYVRVEQAVRSTEQVHAVKPALFEAGSRTLNDTPNAER